MNVIINGMNMPNNCWECPIINGETGECKRLHKIICDDERPRSCPLQEQKTGKRSKDMANYKDRREQRKVTETMNALLLPLLPHLNSDTAIIVGRALYLLAEIEVETQESEG